jgi:hypothetical protein
MIKVGNRRRLRASGVWTSTVKRSVEASANGDTVFAINLGPFKRCSALVAALAVGTLISACGHSAAPSGVPTGSRPLAAMVSLHGEMIRVGGPAGAANLPLPGHVVFTSDKNTIQVTVPNSGQFEVSLLPGTYTMIGSSPLIDAGSRVCAAERPVVVKIGTLAPHVQVVCSIP